MKREARHKIKSKIHSTHLVKTRHKIKHHHLKTKEHIKVNLPKTNAAGIKIISTYDFKSGNIPITIKIYTKKGEFVPIYEVSI